MPWFQQENTIEKSKYNAGALKIERLNASWVICKRHWRQGNYSELNEELDLIWFELEADATNNEITETNKLDKEVVALKQKKAPEREKVSDFFSVMKKKWKLLFRIEKHQGLGKKYIDASDEELS